MQKRLFWMGMLVGLLLVSGLPGQSPAPEAPPDWPTFRQQAESYYTFLARSQPRNLSFYLSSAPFLQYLRQLGDTLDYYPLKFVWTPTGNHFFILRAVPQVVDSSDYYEYIRRVNELKQLFRGLLVDWEKFFVKSPFADIPPEARIRWGKDTVSVAYWVEEGGKRLFMKRTYFRNGLLARDIWQDGQDRVVNYPIYREVEGRWVCFGWDTQVYQADSIVSGLAIRADVQKIDSHWLPMRLDILAQSSKHPGQQSLTSLYFKNFQFNEDIEIISTTPAADTSRQQAP